MSRLISKLPRSGTDFRDRRNRAVESERSDHALSTLAVGLASLSEHLSTLAVGLASLSEHLSALAVGLASLSALAVGLASLSEQCARAMPRPLEARGSGHRAADIEEPLLRGHRLVEVEGTKHGLANAIDPAPAGKEHALARLLVPGDDPLEPSSGARVDLARGPAVDDEGVDRDLRRALELHLLQLALQVLDVREAEVPVEAEDMMPGTSSACG